MRVNLLKRQESFSYAFTYHHCNVDPAKGIISMPQLLLGLTERDVLIPPFQPAVSPHPPVVDALRLYVSHR
jgi:hypothetical protein